MFEVFISRQAIKDIASLPQEYARLVSQHIKVHRKLDRSVRIMPKIKEKSVLVRVHPRSSASYFR